MDIYREHILDHYRNPRGWGSIDQPTTEATGFNELCGDTLTIQLLFNEKQLTKIAFTGHGCAISLATASLLTEAVVNKTDQEIKELNTHTIEQLLGFPLPPARLKCGLLSLETIQQACAKLKR